MVFLRRYLGVKANRIHYFRIKKVSQDLDNIIN